MIFSYDLIILFWLRLYIFFKFLRGWFREEDGDWCIYPPTYRPDFLKPASPGLLQPSQKKIIGGSTSKPYAPIAQYRIRVPSFLTV